MTDSRRAKLGALITRTRAAIEKRSSNNNSGKNGKHLVLLPADKNMVALGRRTCKRIDIRRPLASLITEHFGQRAELFAPELDALQKTRDAIVDVKDDEHGVQLLGDYYAQFARLAVKLPPHCGVDFTWQLFGYITNDVPAFERANVLYALAGVYSRLALEANRSTVEGLKKANAQFQLAAGCVDYINRHLAASLTFLSTLDESLSSRHLVLLRSALLAQAQECVWQKAALDEMKDKLVAQLAEQTSAYYAAALDTAQESDLVSADLIHHLSAKASHFSAIAQLRMSMAAVASRAYGEEIARLRLASEAAKSAVAHATPVGNAVLKEASALAQHIAQTLQRAERDNDLIYLVTVPDSTPLKAIVPTAMVKPVQPECLSITIDSAFDKLQSYVVRNVIETYVDRRNRAVREAVVQPLLELSQEMHATLATLGLPGILMASEQPSGLPATLISQSEGVRRRGGLAALRQGAAQVQALLQANKALLEQIRELMEDEAKEDEEARSYYGSARWSRPQSAEYFAAQAQGLQRYEAFLDQAQSSDQLVRDKLEAWGPKIDRLCLPETELTRLVPGAAAMELQPAARREADLLKQAYLKWEQVEVERKVLLEQAGSITASQSDAAFERDALTLANELQAARTESIDASAFEDLMQQHVTLNTQLKPRIARESATNRQLAQELQESQARFQAAKNAANVPHSQRERVLQELSLAAERFDELTRNLDEGTKFYTDLHRALNRIGDEVQSMTEERLQEALGARQLIDQESTRRAKRSTAWNEADGIKFR